MVLIPKCAFERKTIWLCGFTSKPQLICLIALPTWRAIMRRNTLTQFVGLTNVYNALHGIQNKVHAGNVVEGSAEGVGTIEQITK